MIIVTGGAGFIGSAIVWRLNTRNITDILIVDELGTTDKWKNLVGLKYSDYINKTEFIENIKLGVNYDVEAIIHMGANSSTTERDADHLMSNNFEYTKTLAQYCVENNVRFIYASSAATYGDGNLGFVDDENKLETLRPLNMYGYSKALFDIWAKNNKMLDKIVGIKYFNVYGPNEYHKGDMRSVVHKAYQQILETGKVVLFRSDRPDYKDGEQKRDFVYVKDAVDMTLYFLDNKNKNGIYNVGSGNARTWNDLVSAIFTAIGKKKNIEYIDMPKHLSAKYQYFTQAELGKIKAAGYASPVTSLEEGVGDYVKNYLIKDRFLE